MLIDAGADVARWNSQGRTALSLAASSSSKQGEGRREAALARVALLLAHPGVDVDQWDQSRRTADEGRAYSGGQAWSVSGCEDD